MRKIFAFIVIIFTATAVFSYACPRQDVQNDKSDEIMYFYQLGRLNDSRDSLEIHYTSIGDTIDTLFRLPIYKFTKEGTPPFISDYLTVCFCMIHTRQ